MGTVDQRTGAASEVVAKWPSLVGIAAMFLSTARLLLFTFRKQHSFCEIPVCRLEYMYWELKMDHTKAAKACVSGRLR